MPRQIKDLTGNGIIAEMRAELRRLWRAVGSSQSPVGEYDEYTLASSSDSAHTLTFIPGLSLIPIACLNGLPGRYGTDYTVNFTTGVVTWSATKVAGDILSVFYQTTGDLVALSGTADVGAITDTFNRGNSALHGTTTSDGNATWNQVASSGYVTGDDVNIVSNTVTVNVGGVLIRGDYLDAGRTDGTCSATIASVYGTPSFGGQTWIFGRYDPATGNMVRARWIHSTGAFTVEEGNLGSGMFTVGAGATGTLAAGDVFSLVLSGTTASLQKNGSTLFSGPLTHYTGTTTDWGLAIRDGGAGAVAIDTWTVGP